MTKRDPDSSRIVGEAAVEEFESSIKQFDADLAAVGREVAYVAFDRNNDQQGYRYASAAAVLNKVNESLFSRGISVQPDVAILFNEATAKGAQRVIVKLTLTLKRGVDERKFTALGSGADYGDKAVMKAMTSAHKYAYALAFAISWGDDPEADSSVDKEPAAAPKARAKRDTPKSTLQDLLLKIETATSADDLPSKEEVIAHRSNEQYTTLVAAHKAATAKFSNN